MRRIVFIAAAQITLGAAWAQQPATAGTRISALPCGHFYVDGQMYTGSANFNWPVGSTHTLSNGALYNISTDVKCAPAAVPVDVTADSCQAAWEKACAPLSPPCSAAPVAPCLAAGSWVNDNGTMLDGPNLVITATPEITYYRTDWQIYYRVIIRVSPDNYGAPFSCSAGPNYGKLYVDSQCYDQDTFIWAEAGKELKLQAYPPQGYVFAGWMGGPLGGITAFDTSVVVNNPMAIEPRFEPAKLVYIRTTPSKLQFIVDGAKLTEEAMPLTWARNSTHVLSSVSPQLDLSTREMWVFDSWGHGGEETQEYQAGTSSASLELMLNYAPGSAIKFLTVPYGLKLTIDGRDNWPTYDFVWKTGSKHTVSALAEQTDGAGRKYAFNSWSVPGEATMEYEVPAMTAEVRARYDLLGRLRINSPAGGVDITVDGQPCRTPCVIDRRAGETAQISAPENITMNESSRYIFQSFSDGGPRERTWTAGTEETLLIVNYQGSHRVQAVADPPEGATFTFEPESADGFYPADTAVTVTAHMVQGYRFKNWEFDAIGTLPRVTVTTTGSKYLRAMVEKIPTVTPTTVKNAAADTPEPGVAAGSLISVYGANLAPEWVQGANSPLAQTLGGVRVLVDDRILPLMFVSPGQINAQLPSDLAEGRYRLLVQGETQEDATTFFNIQRNAPGLFTMPVDSQPFGMILRADSSLATTENPAESGEEVTLLGTGFGPYKEGSIDGFAPPLGMKLTLADSVEILVGDQIVTPTSAAAHPGWVGIQAIKFKVGPEFGSGAVEFKVRVNGRESNKVLLPVK